MNNDLLSTTELRKVSNLQNVPEEQLLWLIKAGFLIVKKTGELLFSLGDPIENMLIVLQGEVRIYTEKAGKLRELTIVREMSITGYLPFSRATHAIGYGKCLTETHVFVCPGEKVRAATKIHYELTEALVQVMTSRVRDLTSLQQQNEKMFALGKLSAGLAHELNNPAAAISRGASGLTAQYELLPELLKKLATMSLPPEKIDGINAVMLYCRKSLATKPVQSMLERAELEDVIAAWLKNRGSGLGDMPENFAAFGLRTTELDQLAALVTLDQLHPILGWINYYVLSVKMTMEIELSSRQISELVSSVKIFTHMDRDGDKQSLDIHSGIRNSLTMLNYKIKKGRVQIIEKFDTKLPEVIGLAGELNQVWTNIIDNALDAMEASGQGRLEIQTRLDGPFVCVYIRDNGPGIPEELRSQIFDPFFTTKGIGKGTGLGLDVVSHIIRQHSGTVKVNSEPGCTEFVVCFPIINN